MAFAAQFGHVSSKGPRSGQSVSHRLVVFVAGQTDRHVGITLGKQLTVGTQLVVLNLGRMTDRTVHGIGNRSTCPLLVPGIDLCVALGTCRCSMACHGNRLFINKE